MKLSKFGEKFTERSGILELMDDLSDAASSAGENLCMLGGGNPAQIPEMQTIFRKRMEKILANNTEFESMISIYDSHKGNSEFTQHLAAFLNRQYGWKLSEKNICVTNGSQSAFYILFNALAGEYSDGTKKKVLFPLVPEYIGYADQGICSDFFTSVKPEIHLLENHRFKYQIDFKAVEEKLQNETNEIAAIAVSRPTNPTGNVVTDEELASLDDLAKKFGIPLIIDNAYGAPFPNVIFSDAHLIWDENIILSMSLSKFGLPNTRTGIIVANEEIIEAIGSINAIVALANGSLGQSLVTPLFMNDKIKTISNTVIKPFYKQRSEFAFACAEKSFDSSLPWYFHVNEGSFFLWLYLDNYPQTSKELYDALKKREVIVVPGEYFFPGLDDREWDHQYRCVRINYGRPDREIVEGFKILAEEISKGYSK